MTDVRVIAADLDDPGQCAAIVALVDAYAHDPMGGGKGLPTAVRGSLVDGLRAHPTTRIFLAFSGDTPVGVAVCFLGFSTFRAKPLLNVHDLGVLPEWRGRGVGRALLTAIEGAARDEGCCKLTLEVLDANERARGLYRSFGFADYTLGDHASTRFLTKPLEP